MSHSSFVRSLSEVSSSDGSLCRTLLDCSRNSGSNSSVTTSVLLSKMHHAGQKTPSRTPSRIPLTPGRQDGDKLPLGNRRTPISAGGQSLLEREGDRFIPNRASTDMTRAQHAIKDENENKCTEDSEYQRAISESLFTGEPCGGRILRFKSDVRDVVRNMPLRAAASPPNKITNNRLIPQMPEKVLDAPDIMDDFYLNILDWSVDNMLAVALNQDIYLWNALTGAITHLMSAGLEGEYIASLSWSPDATQILAVGTSMGRVQLWNSETQSLLRTMRLGETGAVGRVPIVTWREHIVTSGSRSGHIRQHDTRVAQHEVGVSDFHTQEVCGLSWSTDKRFLASGANDNCVAIWSTAVLSQTADTQPTVTLNDHQAAVKALAWCPWKNNLLCTGGGTTDHTLRFWNTNTGNCAKSVDVVAQVSGIIWNSEYRELVTSHGTPKNRLVLWRYPAICPVAELMEHQGRVLCIASSPNNEMVASCASDETLRIWNCFEVDKVKKQTAEKTMRASALTRTMR
ncbi:cell division cycle 20, cofactor of APC complex [Paragonimus westermani]|uniref:Cell division cycle 20, cofactor of APC complex n=1 Tax=Paragonimus westermani TaxID=34504 RepID=A0A5J4P1S8_9TREM|nr:cell division cycle 20, cofactor of APC complex [Paragonimus westermani]